MSYHHNNFLFRSSLDFYSSPLVFLPFATPILNFDILTYHIVPSLGMVLKKHEIEAALHAENQAIQQGQLREDNPLDQSDGFNQLCEACRRGDLKTCQEKLQENVNINARDRYDYTPLILVRSLELPQHYIQ